MSGYNEIQHGPQGDYPPPGYGSAQPGYGYTQPGYAPAPPLIQPHVQQTSNNNVVVVGQPSTDTTPIVQHRPPRANDYMICTVVLLILCLINLNFVAVLLLIPALICSMSASNHNNRGDYESAKRCGELAFCCDICVIVKYIIVVIAVIVFVILFFTGVIAIGAGAVTDSM